MTSNNANDEVVHEFEGISTNIAKTILSGFDESSVESISMELQLGHDEEPQVDNAESYRIDQGSVAHLVLRYLADTPSGATSVEISERVDERRETVSHRLTKLYRAGFVNRDTSKRPFRYWITNDGRQRRRWIDR